jgi:hypothetical protein
MGLILTKFTLVNWPRDLVISNSVIAGFKVGHGWKLCCPVQIKELQQSVIPSIIFTSELIISKQVRHPDQCNKVMTTWKKNTEHYMCTKYMTLCLKVAHFLRHYHELITLSM